MTWTLSASGLRTPAALHLPSRAVVVGPSGSGKSTLLEASIATLTGNPLPLAARS